MKEIDNSVNVKPMKIDANQTSHQTAKIADKTGALSDKQALKDKTVDTVTLTRTAESLSKLQDKLSTIPDIDSKKVEAIKASIQEGSYEIDFEKIVDGLLNIEKDII